MSNIPNSILIDDEDRAMLEVMGKWHISEKGYCVRWKEENNVNHTIRMHRVILNCPSHMQVDHINGNRLDNRKCNLRIVTNQQNQWNRTKAKGYSWDKNKKKWMARIFLNNKIINLGGFLTEEEAREAYLKAKEKYHTIPV